MSALNIDGSFDHRCRLHLGDLRIRDGQTAAAVSHHRIELMQAGDHALELIHIDVHVLSQLRDVI